MFPLLPGIVTTMSCCITSNYDYLLSNSRHPCQGSPCHAAGPTLPTAECQTSQSDLPLSSCLPQAGTSITPDITLTKPRVHNPFPLSRLALNSSDFVGGQGVTGMQIVSNSGSLENWNEVGNNQISCKYSILTPTSNLHMNRNADRNKHRS